MTARPVPAVEGRPVVAVDCGGSRSWSAAAAIWPTGRIESWALTPGEPDLASQEVEDQVATGSYRELVVAGGLSVDEGQHVPSIERLLARIWAWEPVCICCDPFRSGELAQVVGGRVRIVEERQGRFGINQQRAGVEVSVA